MFWNIFCNFAGGKYKNIMCTIKIQNLGPIKNVEFNLNRVNIITGPQCSGKSTIAKVVSCCSWIEKDVIRRQMTSHVTRNFFVEKLFVYHQLNDYPLHKDVLIEYYGDAVSIKYTYDSFEIIKVDSFEQKSLGKIAYLPAERNIAALENIESLQLPEINIRGYLWEWFSIRSKYTETNPLQLFSIGVKYYYIKDKGDFILLENGQSIPFNAASSGLQSVTPLYAYMSYITSWIYQNREDESYEKLGVLKKAMAMNVFQSKLKNEGFKVSEDVVEHNIEDDTLEAIDRIVQNVRKYSEQDLAKLDDQIKTMFELEKRLSRPHYSRIILEEPEMNLFPQSQIDLVYDILKMVNVSRDSLFINTHSPYILYALNNCMLGGLLKDNIDDDELLIHKESFIHPTNVSVWELRDGEFSSKQDNEEKTIQDARGLIRNNYFDRVMQNVMADFHCLMNYYD